MAARAGQISLTAQTLGAVLSLIAMIALAISANAGLRFVPNANAASTDSVLVTATVSDVISLADQCSGAYSIDVLLNNYVSDTCEYRFGSTTDSSTTVRIDSSAGAFASGVFSDHSGGCGPLINDTIGIKYTTGSAGVSSSLGCTVSAAGTNADFLPVPDAFTNACAATTAITTNSCTLAIGIKETGDNAAPGTYSATLDLDVIG